MRKYFDLLFRGPEKSIALVHLRERLLKMMLFSSSMIGTALFAFAIIPAYQKGLFFTILIYGVLYAWCILLAFVTRLPYRLRAIGFLGIFYVLGGINLFESGFNVDAGLLFITSIAIAILLMDVGGGVVELVLVSVTVSIFGLLNVSKDIRLPMGLPQSNPLLWIIGGIIFFLMGLLLVYSLTVVLRGLEVNLAKVTSLAAALEQTNQSLRMSEARYRTLVETSPGLVVLLDLNGNILMANKGGLALFGYENLEEMAGKNYLVFIAPESQSRVANAFQRTLQGGPPNDLECQACRKDGTQFIAEINATLVTDEAGRPQSVIAVGKDISARKAEEQILREAKDALAKQVVETTDQLRQTANRLEELVKHGPTVIYSYRASDLALTYISENVAALLGFSATDFSESELFWERIHPEDKKHIFALRDHARIQNKYIYDYRFLHKDGAYRWLRDERVLLRDTDGNPLEYVGSCSDITELKSIEETLRESEGRYRELLENSMQGVVVFQDMRIVYTNQAISESFGYGSEELKSLTPAEIIMHVHPDDRRMFQERLQRRLEGSTISDRYTIRFIHKNGEIRWVEARTVLMELQGKPALLTTAIDITEIKQVEAELRESSKILQTILNASRALVFLVDTNGVLITSNDKFAKRMGLKADSIPGTSMYDILPEEVHIARKVTFDQVISSSKPITIIDSREGTWFENDFYPILDESGKVVRVAVFARDVTEQRRVMEVLRASEEQYRTLSEAAHDLIFTIDKDDRISYVNSFGANFLGLEPQQMLGQPRERFFPADTNQLYQESLQRVFKTGEAYSEESAIRFPTGIVWLNTWLVPLKDDTGEVTSVLGVSRDITERKRSEETLQQARDELEERVMERTKELLASQEKLRALTAQTVKAQEEERRAISRELHDEAGQALIGLKFNLAAIESAFPEAHTAGRQTLADAMKIIDQTNAHIRSLAQRLRPPVLEIGGIHLSLQDYCQEITERTKLPIYYQGLDIPGLPDEMGISLYRFVQEALTNILKHAHATEVKVRLQYRKGEISLSVSDDGRGMEKTLQPDGVGLLGLRERLALLGGRLEIHSRKGRGVNLVACIPWKWPGRD